MIYLAAISAVSCGVAMILSIITLYMAFTALAAVKGMEKSTHSIQYVPLDDKPVAKQMDEIDEQMFADLGNREAMDAFEESMQ